MPTGYLDNYYARLGVAKNATAEEIRASYHQAARRLHPDTNTEPGATELFLHIQEAYEILSDESRRKAYDTTLPPDIASPPDILVNAVYSRTILPRITDLQLVYVLLDMLALPEKAEKEDFDRAVLNVCLVLDTSTSMAGLRLDMVKTTAIQLLRSLKPEDVLSVVSFNDRAEVILPAGRGQDYRRAESQVSVLQARGGTEILMGLQTAMNEVGQSLNPAYLNHIILITDGRTYGDEDASLKLAEAAAEKGITISGIGIGSEWNDEFLDALAGKTGGTSAYAASAGDIKNLLENKFKGLSNTYANNVSLQFDCGPNVELRYAFRLSPEAGGLPPVSPIKFGNLPLGPRLSIVFEFLISSIPAKADLDLTLMDGQLKMFIPSRTIPMTNARFSLSRTTAENPVLEPPPQVLVKAMSRLSLYRLQEQARQELATGDVEKATQRLQYLATQLLASGQPELAHTVMLEVKHIGEGQVFGEEQQKAIKYGTRSLLLPSGIGLPKA